MTQVYAVFDTETSGLFDFSKPADADGQPRLARVSIILTDEDLNEIETQDWYVKPDGWTMDPKATAVNGLTDEFLAENGAPIRVVLDAYTDVIQRGHVIVAYNAQFDTKVMRGELRKAGMPDLFEQTPNICMMRSAQKAGVKNANGKGFPKLADACAHFGIPHQPGPHSSLQDAQDTLAIFRALTAAGAVIPAAVHFAKNPPVKEAVS